MSEWPDDLYCDICGWGDTIQGFPDDPHHFCHRHRADEVRAYMNGDVLSYADIEAADELCDRDIIDYSGSAKFMLVSKIITMVLDNIDVVRDGRKQPRHRRKYYMHTDVSHLEIIKMIEEVYGDGGK
jgi:hypothetical protein